MNRIEEFPNIRASIARNGYLLYILPPPAFPPSPLFFIKPEDGLEDEKKSKDERTLVPPSSNFRPSKSYIYITITLTGSQFETAPTPSQYNEG